MTIYDVTVSQSVMIYDVTVALQMTRSGVTVAQHMPEDILFFDVCMVGTTR